MLPSDLIAPKNDANHAIYWRKISLLKTLLAETFPLFPCLPYNKNMLVISAIKRNQDSDTNFTHSAKPNF